MRNEEGYKGGRLEFCVEWSGIRIFVPGFDFNSCVAQEFV